MSRNLAPQESIGDLLGLRKVSAIAIDIHKYWNLPWLRPLSDMSPARPSELLTMPFLRRILLQTQSTSRNKNKYKSKPRPLLRKKNIYDKTHGPMIGS